MMLYDIKKVYAALMAVQEGVVQKSLTPDIKGAAIRGTDASATAKVFIKEFMIRMC